MINHANCTHEATKAARAKCRRDAQPTPTAFDGPRTKNGFPLATCPKCGGTGHYPSSAYNGVCLKCTGTGFVDFNRSSRRQRLLYEAHVTEAQTTDVRELAVGDTVLVSIGPIGAKQRWEAIENITLDADAVVGHNVVNGVTTALTGRLTITTPSTSSDFPLFANVVSGSTARAYPLEGYTMRRRTDLIDPAPWLARIKY